jgi:hypothetical protein
VLAMAGGGRLVSAAAGPGRRRSASSGRRWSWRRSRMDKQVAGRDCAGAGRWSSCCVGHGGRGWRRGRRTRPMAAVVGDEDGAPGVVVSSIDLS